jgi:carbonic anhydrase/acetyltransferase-like protein (isoleucine patch superfamily)
MPVFALDGIAPQLPADDSCWIAPDAYLIGKVSLGRDVSIWYGSILRGDNEPIVIGDGSNVQESCILHTDIGFPLKVGRGCTLGHRVMLHGCTVEDNCLIGIGATILNNATIGENSLIGAHTLITEGKVIPPGSLVMGSPGRVVRPLSEEEILRIVYNAKHYVENGRRYRTGLKSI